MIYLFGLLTAIALFLGGYVAFTFKYNTKLLISFCGGTLVTAAFLDIIPEALELREFLEIKAFMIIVIFSFLVFLIIDKFLFTHGHSHEDHHTSQQIAIKQRATPKLLFASGILLHTFIDGIIIGSSFLVSGSMGVVIATVILLHDFTDGISTVTIMKHHNQGAREIKLLLAIAGSVTILGIFFSQLFKPTDILLSNLLGIFAGLFIYLGAADLLPEAHKDRSSIELVAATIVGAIMVVLFSFFL
jgi:ZIP family zinc transporter